MSLVTNEVLEALLTKLKGIFDTKVDKVAGKGLSTNDYTATEKEKLAGIAEGANKTTVDAALSSTSTNPVQNKVINTALTGKVPTSRKVNNKALSADITLSAADVSAIPASQKGAASGVAELDEAGKVPAAQLPSYVDDVIEGYLSGGKFYKESAHTTQITGEAGKIYVDLATNKTYRWSGSAFVEISSGGVALGETSSTAYRGDRGKAAYDHSQKTSGNPHNVTKSDVGLSNVTNVKQIAGLASGATQNHVIVFGADGYTVKDSGFTIGKSVPADAKFTDTTYSAFKAATASAAGGTGLVPAPAAGAQAKFLRGDGTWQTPPNTTYSVATQTTNGLMSAADKKKLDGMTEMTTTELDNMFNTIFA